MPDEEEDTIQVGPFQAPDEPQFLLDGDKPKEIGPRRLNARDLELERQKLIEEGEIEENEEHDPTKPRPGEEWDPKKHSGDYTEGLWPERKKSKQELK